MGNRTKIGGLLHIQGCLRQGYRPAYFPWNKMQILNKIKAPDEELTSNPMLFLSESP